MKLKYFVLGLFCLPLIALDVALVATGKLNGVALISSLVTFVLVFVVFWFFSFRGQRVSTDERTIRLARKAMAYSWLFSIYVTVLLSASDTLGILALTGQHYLGIVIMTMAFSYLVLHVVMIRRADAE